jgi:hypothetical protein
VSPQNASVANGSAAVAAAGAATPTTYYVQTSVPTSTTMTMAAFPTTVLMKGLPPNVQPNDVMTFLDGLIEVRTSRLSCDVSFHELVLNLKCYQHRAATVFIGIENREN